MNPNKNVPRGGTFSCTLIVKVPHAVYHFSHHCFHFFDQYAEDCKAAVFARSSCLQILRNSSCSASRLIHGQNSPDYHLADSSYSVTWLNYLLIINTKKWYQFSFHRCVTVSRAEKSSTCSLQRYIFPNTLLNSCISEHSVRPFDFP